MIFLDTGFLFAFVSDEDEDHSRVDAVLEEYRGRRCVICKTGEVKAGATGFTVERGAMTLVLKGVPARVCGRCGEAYVDEATTKHIEGDRPETTSHVGVQVVVQDYVAG